MVPVIRQPHLTPLLLPLRQAAAAPSPSWRSLHRQRAPKTPPPVPFISFVPRTPFVSCSASADRDCWVDEKKAGEPSTSLQMDLQSPPHRDLMVDLLSALKGRLGHDLLPSAVSPDVLSFQNESGTCKGTLDILSGADGSTVDFVLESWLHCELPFGVLDITTLFAFLSGETDAPHLLMEFIQNGPISLILLMDLLPRRDLVLHPDYLDHFYQQTPLEKARQDLQSVPEVSPYWSPVLFIRSVLSPTAVAVNINCGSEGASRMGEVLRAHVAGAAKVVMETWLDKCACCGEIRKVGASDRTGLLKRDNSIKRKAVEIDLASNLPKLFGPEVADRVIAEIQKAFGTVDS